MMPSDFIDTSNAITAMPNHNCQLAEKSKSTPPKTWQLTASAATAVNLHSMHLINYVNSTTQPDPQHDIFNLSLITCLLRNVSGSGLVKPER